MLMDVHTHIFPPQIIADRQAYFAGEPTFQALYQSPKARMIGAEDLIRAMDEARIDVSVTFGFPWTDTELAARHNDYVLAAAARYPARIVALACVYPLSRGAAAEADRCLRAGARGLGELAIYGQVDEAEALRHFEPLIACLSEPRRPLLVHANEPVGHAYPGKAPLKLSFYYELARKCAGIPLILAHWGGGLCFYELLKKEAGEVLANVTYDTAASPYLYKSSIYARMVAAIGQEKILFGSDYPLLAPARYFKEMEQCGLSAEAMGALCGANSARLFGLIP